MRLLTALLPVLATAFSVHAQIAPPSLSATVTQATEEAVAKANAEGDNLLVRSGATDLFDNETEQRKSGAIELRHKASGMLCVFNPGKTYNNITVSPSPVRGDDVGCTTENIIGVRSQFITKTADPLTKVVAREMTPMLQRFKGQFKGEVDVNLEASNPFVPLGQEPRKGATIGFSTATTYERADFFRTGDWVVESRFTSPPQFARDPSLLDRSALVYVLERERHVAPASR